MSPPVDPTPVSAAPGAASSPASPPAVAIDEPAEPTPPQPPAPPPPPEEQQRREQRALRFAEPVDAAAELAKVRDSRKRAFEPAPAFVPPGGLNYCSGRRRPGDIQALAEAAGDTCRSVDIRSQGPGKVDLNVPAVREQEEANASQYSWMHGSWDCFSWSPALVLPSGKTGLPIGAYRSDDEPDGKASLPPDVKRRVTNSTEHMRLGLRLGRKIDANGGSVSFEFAPDCRDPASP